LVGWLVVGLTKSSCNTTIKSQKCSFLVSTDPYLASGRRFGWVDRTWTSGKRHASS
jgi:hypothetical protein